VEGNTAVDLGLDAAVNWVVVVVSLQVCTLEATLGIGEAYEVASFLKATTASQAFLEATTGLSIRGQPLA
jgi:hypothetical protein